MTKSSETTVSPTKRIAEYTLEHLLAATRDVHPSPGSGSSGAIALALAASCAAKAANISLKHEPTDTALHAAAGQFSSLATEALEAGDEDSAAFEQYIAHGEKEASAPLARASSHFESLIDRLEQLMHAVKARIHPIVAGDFVAATALSRAARLIQVRNRSEQDANP